MIGPSVRAAHLYLTHPCLARPFVASFVARTPSDRPGERLGGRNRASPRVHLPLGILDPDIAGTRVAHAKAPGLSMVGGGSTFPSNEQSMAQARCDRKINPPSFLI